MYIYINTSILKDALFQGEPVFERTLRHLSLHRVLSPSRPIHAAFTQGAESERDTNEHTHRAKAFSTYVHSGVSNFQWRCAAAFLYFCARVPAASSRPE